MKSSLTRIAAVAALAMMTTVAVAVPDSYLYWMVSPGAYNYLDSSKTPVTYDSAKVKIDGTDNYLSWYNQGETTAEADYMPGSAAGGTPAMYWGLDGTTLGSSTTFLFELYNNNDLVGWYSTQVGSQFIASGTNESGAQAAYQLTGVVPEPTSGLLSLFGLAALALRRRKRA